jgi:hypothetical protein
MEEAQASLGAPNPQPTPPSVQGGVMGGLDRRVIIPVVNLDVLSNPW